MEKESVCEQFEQHPRRKLCARCYNPQEEHSFGEEDVAEVRNILKTLAERQKVPESAPNQIYSWVPPKCPSNRYDDYFKEMPENIVPKYRSAGQTNRLKQLFKQIPLTDLSESNCRFVEPECLPDLKSHIQNLINRALKFGFVKEWETGMPLQCPKCLILLETGDLVVMPSSSSLQAYHPACFICNQCKEHAVDLIHCQDDEGTVFCIRHYSETLKKRCHACDELIFALRYAQARDHYYHRDHLFCFSPDCDTPLEDNKGFEKDGELYCSVCYEEKFAVDCEKCGKRIDVDSKHVTYNDKCWHLKCFSCEKCKKVLSDFEVHENQFYCIDCYNEDYAPRCEECKELFEGHVKVVKYEGSTYHVDCFKCSNCKHVIGAGSFIPNGDKVYCKECHLRNFGIKCYRCKYAITDDNGVMYNKQPYHTSCFTCHSCCTQLANKPFKMLGSNWYCMLCFGNTACMKCQVCGEPIYLGENDVLYSYDDYKWHSNCFVCKSCNHSLADTAFAIRGSDLICKNCSSQEATASAKASQ